MEQKLLDVLLSLQGHMSELSVDIKNMKGDISDLKKAMREMVEIEKRQQRIESDYRNLLNCCEEVYRVKEQLNEHISESSVIREKVQRLEKSKEEQSDRFWKLGLSIAEKLILWLIIGAVLIKTHLLRF